MTRLHAAKELMAAAETLKEWGCFPATDGNLSMRTGVGKVLITKSGIAKSHLRANSFVVQDLRRAKKPDTSSEWFMHRAAYLARPEINCVLHVHAPFLTAFAAAHRVPNRQLLSEASVALGEIVLVPYAAPGSEQLGHALIHAGKSATLYVLANHGAVAVGKTVREAQHVVERAEFLARTEIMSEMLGGGHLLPNTNPNDRKMAIPHNRRRKGSTA